MEMDELYKCLVKRMKQYRTEAVVHATEKEYPKALESHIRALEIMNTLTLIAPTQKEHEQLSLDLGGFRGLGIADVFAMHGLSEPDPEEFLKAAVGLLRRWQKPNNGTAQFLLTTDTIQFLDKYDKSVSLKEGQ